MKVGDLVFPTKHCIEQFRFNRATFFPWRVYNILDDMVWLEHVSRYGNRIIEKWWVGWWNT